jgi:hypothetical protein
VAEGGRGKCAACASELQDQINQDLAREVPYRVLAKRHGISVTALRNHKLNHLTPALIALTKANEQAGASTVLDEIETGIESVHAIYEAARKSKNIGQALGAQRTLQGWIELKARVTGELDTRPQVTVNVLQTKEFLAVQAVFLEELEGHPEVARRISRRLKVLEGGVE